MFDNAKILITGGTGSFGWQATKSLLKRFSPEKIVIYSRDEFKQYEMRERFQSDQMRFLIGDVRDRDRLAVAVKGIDFIIHAAALKQVPVAEYNPMECIKTNVHGAENIVDVARDSGVKKIIGLSSDKASNPINLYGATKLASDKLFVAANNMYGKDHPLFSVVRYGNVVNSRGSVVPYFRRLIAEGDKTLPITDKEMTRFWITLEQGVDFVLRCFERMNGGEVFVPKIPSVKITDVATALAPNLGQRIIGIRAGEKIHEVLCAKDASHLTLEFSDHFVIQPTIRFVDVDHDYSKNRLSEAAVPVPPGFEYCSGTNQQFLSVEDIAEACILTEDR